MNQNFKISREELLTLAKKIYQEACNGYLDLCDTVTDSMVCSFLDDRSPLGESILSAGSTFGVAASIYVPPESVYVPPESVVGVDSASMQRNLFDTSAVVVTSTAPSYVGVAPIITNSALPGTSSSYVGMSQVFTSSTVAMVSPTVEETGLMISDETMQGIADVTPIREEVFVRNENYNYV